MRLTLESTIFKTNNKVTIEVENDDLTIDQVAEMFKSALYAKGYQHENIKELFEPNDDIL